MSLKKFLSRLGVPQAAEDKQTAPIKSYPSEPQITAIDPQQLHRILSERLTAEVIRDITFTLGIDYEDLPGSSHLAKVRELIMHCQQNGQIPQLAAAVQTISPDLASLEINAAAVSSSPPKTPTNPLVADLQARGAIPPVAKEHQVAFHRLLSTYFSEIEMRELLFDMGLDPDEFPANNPRALVREAVLFAQRRHILPDMIALAQQKRPSLAWQSALPAELLKPTQVFNQGYNTAAMRTLIFDTFPSDAEFTAFCRQHTPEVIVEFGTGMTFREKVQAWMMYGRSRQELDVCLIYLAEVDPPTYARHGPYRGNKV